VVSRVVEAPWWLFLRLWDLDDGGTEGLRWKKKLIDGKIFLDENIVCETIMIDRNSACHFGSSTRPSSLTYLHLQSHNEMLTMRRALPKIENPKTGIGSIKFRNTILLVAIQVVLSSQSSVLLPIRAFKGAIISDTIHGTN
jgi:hypothetical protein